MAKIPFDAKLSEYDLKGENVFFIPDDAPIVLGAKKALKNIGIL